MRNFSSWSFRVVLAAAAFVLLSALVFLARLVQAGTLTVNSSGASSVPIQVVAIYTNAVITVGPSSVTTGTNQTISFSVTATGNNLAYQWSTNSVPVVDGGRVSGGQTATLTYTGTILGDSNTTCLITVTNPCSSDSASALLYVTNSIAPNGLLNDLLAYHDMEEGNGADRMDSTANGLNLTNAGNMNQTATHIEGSFAAMPGNGTSALTNGSSLYKITGSFTEMLWVRPSGSLDGLQIAGRCCDVNVWEVGFGSGGSVPFFVRNAADSGYITCTSTTNLDRMLNKWSVIIWGYDATGQSNFIRINRERKQLVKNTDGIRNVASSLVIGGQSGPISGSTPLIMDVHVTWTNALTDAQIDTQINGYDFDAQTGTPLWLESWTH